MNDKLQKKQSVALREKTQYLITFGVIASLLVVSGFPVVVVFFFGVFAFLLWKTFSQPRVPGVKEVFEFYLSASEILRDDERRWFGFEVREVISRAEKILHVMHGAPPLVYFAIGALYHKIGDHEAAVTNLAYVVENDNADESTYIHPSGDLREYVKLLRKIERDPKEAPKTSAAVRLLERLRKNRGAALLADSREKVRSAPRAKTHALEDKGAGKNVARDVTSGSRNRGVRPRPVRDAGAGESGAYGDRKSGAWKLKGASKADEDRFPDRKPITEVLHDIYDKNIQ